MQFRVAVPLAFLLLLGLASQALCQIDDQIDDRNGTGSRLSSPAIPTRVMRSYHDGGIRDLGAIGNRKLGCNRGFGNWYSLEHQIAMGRDYATEIESRSKLVTDPEINEYINRLGQNLVRNSDSLVPFTIKVIESDDINAFALPGGFFYVDTGLILAADSEAELAGVMAHEIAHVAACHAVREHTRGQLMNFAAIPLVMIGGPVGYGVYQAASLALPLSILKFSRGFESEADFLGVQYMYKAGYDPQAFTAFFEKVKNLEGHKQNVVAKAFETHPQTPDRIAKTQKEISTLLPPQLEYKVDTSEFQDAKTRLAEIGKLRRTNGGKSNAPTLRRASPTGTATDSKAPDVSSPALERKPGD